MEFYLTVHYTLTNKINSYNKLLMMTTIPIKLIQGTALHKLDFIVRRFF